MCRVCGDRAVNLTPLISASSMWWAFVENVCWQRALGIEALGAKRCIVLGFAQFLLRCGELGGMRPRAAEGNCDGIGFGKGLLGTVEGVSGGPEPLQGQSDRRYSLCPYSPNQRVGYSSS
jgi:hypothetical protein